MKEISKNLYRWHAIKTIQKRVGQSKLWTMGIFITMSIGFSISTIFLMNAVRYVEINLLSIEKQILLIPILSDSILISLYLSMLASISVAREIDKGRLETLLYGPVDESAYILGNFMAYINMAFYILLGILIWSNLCVWILNLSFSFNILGIMLSHMLLSFVLIGFGLFCAIWGKKTRNALIYFILIILLIGGIQIADIIVSQFIQVNKATLSDPVIIIRNLLTSTNRIIQWISPFSLSLKGMQAIVSNHIDDYLLHNGLLIIEGLIFIILSIYLLRKKGVRGIEE